MQPFTSLWQTSNRYRGSIGGIDGVAATAGLGTKASAMLVRGAILRPRLRQAGGPLLVGRGVRIRQPHLVAFEGRAIIEDYVEVQGLSRRGLVFGAGVSIGSGTLIRPSGYYSSDVGEGMRVGARVGIGPGCYFGCSGFVSIGSDVMFGPGVRLFAENHRFDSIDVTIKQQGVERSPITIEDDVWLGSGVTITAGVSIGAGSVIAAGSVVTSDVEPFTVVGGVPARLLRHRRQR